MDKTLHPVHFLIRAFGQDQQTALVLIPVYGIFPMLLEMDIQG